MRTAGRRESKEREIKDYSSKKLAFSGIEKVSEGWRVGQERIIGKGGRT